jgi:hypothetical protein
MEKIDRINYTIFAITKYLGVKIEDNTKEPKLKCVKIEKKI